MTVPTSIEMALTARQLTCENKGLLAIDESIRTCNGRFALLGIEQTEEKRRSYREMLLSTPGIERYLSGVIFFDETLRQKNDAGIPLRSAVPALGIRIGVKVDLGLSPMSNFPGESVTKGLDGLRERLIDYGSLGVQFTKWRSVVGVGSKSPSSACIQSNAQVLSRYAALSQEAGLVPVVEAEVLMQGSHSLEDSAEVSSTFLHAVFHELYVQKVNLSAMVLKTNMILPGLDSSERPSAEEVADATVRHLSGVVPATIPGVLLLSGGQNPVDATTRLNAMNDFYRMQTPWALSFSFSRALQQEPMKIWANSNGNRQLAQREFYRKCYENGAACRGDYTPDMEDPLHAEVPWPERLVS